MAKRIFEIIFSTIVLALSLPILLISVTIIFFEDFKSPIFTQLRVGKGKKPFTIYKLRTMLTSAPNVATHKTTKDQYLRSSKLIRNLKIDELPQFLNVIIGDMSIVGPRPCLTSQHKLIKERDKKSLFNHKPGITGITQLKNIMMDQEVLQAEIDSIYNDFFGGTKKISDNVFLYFYCLINTVIKVDKKLIYLDKLIRLNGKKLSMSDNLHT